MQLDFKRWLLEEGLTAAKSPLYPLGYGGIGLYPYSWWMPTSADAILYITEDPRLYRYLNGEGPPFSINHIKGKPSFPVQKDN